MNYMGSLWYVQVFGILGIRGIPVHDSEVDEQGQRVLSRNSARAWGVLWQTSGADADIERNVMGSWFRRKYISRPLGRDLFRHGRVIAKAYLCRVIDGL
jgi:hypothetical protein